MEYDRKYAQVLFKKSGMKTVCSRHFCSADEAIRFVEKNKGRWVIKQNGHVDKCFSYVGRREDGEDVIALLKNYKMFNNHECSSIDLQERVVGVELAVARYFNGKDWIGPVMMSIEHKKLFPNGLGPNTSEMGTLMWFDDNDKNKLFNETSRKLTGYLRKINFRGCFDINCMVNEQGAVPLEATPRLGYPAIQVEVALLKSPWGEFLKAVADGRDYDLKWRKGYGIVVLVAVPPFPYEGTNIKYNPDGLRITFAGTLTEDEWSRVHFCEVRRQYNANQPPQDPQLKAPTVGSAPPLKIRGGRGSYDSTDGVTSLLPGDGAYEYIIAANTGYAFCVSGVGKTVQTARQAAYSLTEKICLPRMFYRHDIGLKFIEQDKTLLKKWGYI